MMRRLSTTAPTRILIAPDKFKGTLTAAEAAAAIARGAQRAQLNALLSVVPVADGGEGTVDAVIASGAKAHRVRVRGPLDALVDARWASLGEVAVIELAEASGLLRAGAPSAAQALAAHTRGVGQLIRAALDAGLRRLLVGVGGSASTDGGFGAIVELGARVLDASGSEITDVTRLSDARRLDASGLDSRLADADIAFAVDVRSPLLGEHGAARVFAPQKGADAATVELLEQRLETWAGLLRETTESQALAAHGDLNGHDLVGAAGGVCTPFVLLGLARVELGTDAIGALTGLDAAIEASDLVIVGEGSVDAQSLHGKGPVAIARAAAARGIDVIALAGRCTLTQAELDNVGISATATLVGRARESETAMRLAASLLEDAAAEVVHEWASSQPENPKAREY